MPIRILTLLAVVLFFACPAPAQEKAPAYKTIEAEEFARLVKEAKPGEVVILDVRTPAEHAAGHLENAVLIDYRAKDFDEKIKALDKSKAYFVYCASGYRSSSACKKLGALDVPTLYNLKGGIAAWQRAGKPVVKE